MIVQISTDAGKIGNDVDAVRLQQGGRPESRQLQQLRRIKGAGGEDDFAPCGGQMRLFADLVCDAAGAPSVKTDTRGQRVGDDAKVGAFAHRIEKGCRCR